MLALLLAFAACQSADSTPKKNLLLITLDTFRADRLAAEGVVFEGALTAMGTTMPSHATMLTGLYPIDRGVRWNGDRLDDKYPLLSKLFQNQG